MKNRLISLIITLSIVSALLSLCVCAAPPSLTLSATSTVRAGDTVKVTVKVGGSGILGASFNIEYDSDKLTFKGSSSYPSGWKVESSSKTDKTVFICYDDTSDQSKPISSAVTMCVLEFAVSSKLNTGDTISVKATDIRLTDGNNEDEVSDATYSVKLTKPKSSDSKLASLALDGFKLNESFSPTKTDYTATVKYDTASVSVDTSRSDKSSSVSISGNKDLKVGKNTISIKVTAEDGSSTTYKITVTRPDDPNKSDDSSLSKIELSAGTLEPKFDKNTYSYTVNVDNATQSIKVTPTPSNAKATAKGGEYSLDVGENKIEIKCTSEKGTTSVYTLNVIRTPDEQTSHETGVESGDVTETEQVTEWVTEDEQTDEVSETVGDESAPDTDEVTTGESKVDDEKKSGNILTTPVPLWLTVLIGIIAMIFGMLCSYLVYNRL